MWLLFGLSGLGALALGALDWGSLTLASWLRWAVGAPLWLSGMLLALWATGALGLGRTLGDEGALATRGPYRWLRHPQYLGYGAALLGWALLAGSARTLLAAGMGAGAFLMAAWAEETEREMEDRRVR
jgi:protein-S-isoprenylcysteine O-methyltransferase Ste14